MKLKTSKQIQSIKIYEPGKPISELEREYGINNPAKLASNENPIGHSHKVIDAVNKDLHSMNRYPDPRGYNLTELLANKYKVVPGNIIIGNGSDEIISLLANAFLDYNDEALMPQPSFLMYEICVKIAKGKPVMVPLNDYKIDLNKMLDSITDKTKMVFLTNPFNPTGSVFNEKEFMNFSNKIPEDVLMIVDEAYIEFAEDDLIFNSLKTPLIDKRVVTLRTFSKAYGLAGFRLGYGVMDIEIAKILHKIRPPFNVNSLAQAAGVAAMNDTIFLEKSVAFICKQINFLKNELETIGVTYLPTHANFLMINVKKESTKVFNDLLKLGVIVKSMKSYGFNNWIRVNAGTEKENILFIQALKKVL